MDPSRVDGLARVLKSVAAGRQVIVFTHDDRLPEAVRRLDIDARIIEVTRHEDSVVELRPSLDPVSRNLDDARALARTAELPELVSQQVVPNFCRAAIEADCIAEVLHMGERLARLDKAIDRLVESAPEHMRAVIEALQALRGVAKLTAVTIVTEVGTFKRFRRPTEMMGYTGFVPSEYSSGGRECKGRLTRTGNAHLRHVLGESAWNARHRPWLNLRMKKILPTLPDGVAEIAWKAQERLHRKFTKMTCCRKPAGKVAAAVARELVGFIWAIGTLVESRLDGNNKARPA
jgi:transposase